MLNKKLLLAVALFCNFPFIRAEDLRQILARGNLSKSEQPLLFQNSPELTEKALGEIQQVACQKLVYPHGFQANTQVLMADGSYKQICQVGTGDKVACIDNHTLEPKTSTVIDVRVSTAPASKSKVLSIGGQLICTTDWQEFWASGQHLYWQTAKDLSSKCRLKQYPDIYKSVKIESVEPGSGDASFYAISVDYHGNYIIGPDNIVVHNVAAGFAIPWLFSGAKAIGAALVVQACAILQNWHDKKNSPSLEPSFTLTTPTEKDLANLAKEIARTGGRVDYQALNLECQNGMLFRKNYKTERPGNPDTVELVRFPMSMTGFVGSFLLLNAFQAADVVMSKNDLKWNEKLGAFVLGFGERVAKGAVNIICLPYNAGKWIKNKLIGADSQPRPQSLESISGLSTGAAMAAIEDYVAQNTIVIPAKPPQLPKIPKDNEFEDDLIHAKNRGGKGKVKKNRGNRGGGGNEPPEGPDPKKLIAIKELVANSTSVEGVRQLYENVKEMSEGAKDLLEYIKSQRFSIPTFRNFNEFFDIPAGKVIPYNAIEKLKGTNIYKLVKDVYIYSSNPSQGLQILKEGWSFYLDKGHWNELEFFNGCKDGVSKHSAVVNALGFIDAIKTELAKGRIFKIPRR